MRLNGWMRLWVVLTALWAAPVALVAYDGRPKEGPIYANWVSDIADAVASDLSEQGKSVPSYRVRDALNSEYGPDRQVVEWALRTEKEPRKLNQARLQPTLAKIRRDHQRRLAELPGELRTYAFNALLIWLTPSLLLLGLGFAVAWILRGFQPRAKDTGLP